MAGKTVLRVRREDVVLVSWKKDFITAGIALALITLVSHIYEKSCVDEEVQVVQEVPSVEVAQEVGDDVSTINVGNGEGLVFSDTYQAVVGSQIPALSGASGQAYSAAVAPAMPYPWPVNRPAMIDINPVQAPVVFIYMTLNASSLEAKSIHVHVESHEGGDATAAVYSSGDALLASSAKLTFPSQPSGGWLDFPLLSQPVIEDGKDYWLVAWIDTTTGGVSYGTEVDPPLPPPPGTVLPLIKGASDMAAGNSRLIQ